MKFILAFRRRSDGSREMFDYEWGVIHPTLMITTPSVMRGFKRYAQHRTPDGVSDELYQYGRHDLGWYAFSDHWLDSLEDLLAMFHGDDYPQRMQPHNFGDHNFVIELLDGEVIHDQPRPFTGRGGVKLVNFIARLEGLEQTAFAASWNGDYAENLRRIAASGLVKRAVLNTRLPLDAATFTGTLFEMGGVQTYAGTEELWFADLADLRSYLKVVDDDHDTAKVKQELVDVDRSFSMVVVERVVWDYTADQPPPRPAVENPKSLEALLLHQEKPWGRWNTIEPAHD